MFKKPVYKSLILSTLIISLLPTTSKAQCTVVSALGYTVNISITPKSIALSSNNCQWGYNYNVNFDYNISIVGPNASSLNTLQALITCVNNQVNGAYSLPLNGGVGSATTTSNPYIPVNGTANGYSSPYVSCSDATVSTLNCFKIDLIIQGPGIPYQKISCNSLESFLPVEFLYFDVEKKPNGNALTWAVESEFKNDYFLIETSTDGISWDNLVKVKGAGTSQQAKTYSFFDTQNTQISTYYRLSQTDFDGTRSDLALKFVPLLDFDLKIYPNPSSDGNFHINFSHSMLENTSLVIRNELGLVVFSENMETIGKSGKTTYYSSDLSIGQAFGIYFVEIRSGDQLLHRSKLVIQ